MLSFHIFALSVVCVSTMDGIVSHLEYGVNLYHTNTLQFTQTVFLFTPMSKLIRYLEDQVKPKTTAKQLAAKLGVSASLLSYWMSGHRKPGASKLARVSKITGIKIEDLL